MRSVSANQAARMSHNTPQLSINTITDANRVAAFRFCTLANFSWKIKSPIENILLDFWEKSYHSSFLTPHPSTLTRPKFIFPYTLSIIPHPLSLISLLWFAIIKEFIFAIFNLIFFKMSCFPKFSNLLFHGHPLKYCGRLLVHTVQYYSGQLTNLPNIS